MVGGVKIYIDPKDIYKKLRVEDREKYKNLEVKKVFIADDGTIEILAMCYNDKEELDDICLKMDL